MLPPIPTLQDYGISPSHGFLPMELPLEVLPDLYYSRWEAVAGNLQALILSRRLREVVERLPVLSTAHLQHPAEWRRAYSILAFMAHAYIWGGDKPEEVSSLRAFSNRLLTSDSESTATHLHSFPQDLCLPRTSTRRYICRCCSMELQADIRRRANRHAGKSINNHDIYGLSR